MVISLLTLRRTLHFEARFRPAGGGTESPLLSLDPIFEADFTSYTASSFVHHEDDLRSPFPPRVCSQQCY